MRNWAATPAPFPQNCRELVPSLDPAAKLERAPPAMGNLVSARSRSVYIASGVQTGDLPSPSDQLPEWKRRVSLAGIPWCHPESVAELASEAR